MARKRMIAPSFWTDEKTGECSMMERLLFLGLISNADDEGIGRANPKLLKSLIFPYDDLRISDFEKSLNKLASLKLIKLYQHDEQKYYTVTNFNKHQTINRPTPSELPKPPTTTENNTHEQISEQSVSNHETVTPNIKEVKLKEDKLKESNSMPGAETAPDSNKETPIIELTLNDKSMHPITQKDIDQWSELYPAVDVMQELRNMKGWINANPQRRKTKTGINRFITNWLSKAQNQGGVKFGANGGNISTNTGENRKPQYGTVL